MSEIKLLHCPFCGGEAFVRQNKDEMKTYSAYCGNEDCSASPKVSAYGKEMAIDLWNTRKPMQEIVKRLEEDYADARNSVDIEEDYYLGMCQGLQYAICHVKEVGGMNESFGNL